MEQKVLKQYALGWTGLAVAMIINGISRGIYQPLVGELTAHQISTLSGITLVYLVTMLMNRKWKIQDAKTAQSIGVMWLIMTILFEFGFGHYIIGHPWDRLFADYNILQGRIWSLFLIGLAAIPSIVYRRSKR